MKICDEKLKVENDSLIDLFQDVDSNNRPKISTELLKSLRNFAEHVMIKIYCEDNHIDLDDDWNNICLSADYCRKQGQYCFLYDFRENLHSTSGHRTIAQEYSEAIFLMYYEKLIKIKTLLKNRYDYDVLQNIEKYPLDLDNTFLDHYRKIWNATKDIPISDDISSLDGVDMYYVQKKKPIFFDGKLMYELLLITLISSIDLWRFQG